MESYFNQELADSIAIKVDETCFDIFKDEKYIETTLADDYLTLVRFYYTFETEIEVEDYHEGGVVLNTYEVTRINYVDITKVMIGDGDTYETINCYINTHLMNTLEDIITGEHEEDYR